MTPMGKSQEPERMIAEFFRNSGVGLALMDRQLRFRMINPYLAASNGAPVESHLGKHLEQILGEVAQQLVPRIERVFSANAPQLNWQVSGVVPTSAQQKHWLGSYFPVADSFGTVKQVAAVVVDLDLPTSIHLKPLPTRDVHVLRSWKDIAQYLGTCVKTVQRWEQDQSLPVRRIAAKKKGAAVFAMSDEVEEWLRTRMIKR